MAVSTMLIGIITYSASVVIPEDIFINFGFTNMTLFVQRSLPLDIMVLFMGPATGATAGYAAAYLWNKYLKSMANTL
jgi:hypothetical protein